MVLYRVRVTIKRSIQKWNYCGFLKAYLMKTANFKIFINNLLHKICVTVNAT